MATTEIRLNINRENIVHDLETARAKLDSADGDLVLDCSSVSRIDPPALVAIQKLADSAQAKGVKVSIRGVNVEVYKVLKLMRLAPRFAFVA